MKNQKTDNEKRKLSASQLNTFFDCPLQWKFKYLDKAEPDENFEFINTIYGSAFHMVLEKIFSKNYNRLNLNMPLKELTGEAKRVWKEDFIQEYERIKAEGKKIRASRMSFDDHVADLLYRFQINFIKIMKSNFHEKYSTYMTEKEIVIETRRYIIRGSIDFIGFFEDGSYDIIDFKTGRFFKTKKSIEDDHQILFYNFLCYNHFKRKFPSSFSYLLSNRDRMSFDIYKVEDSFNINHIGYFYKNLDRFQYKVDNAIFTKRDETQKDIQCSFCMWKEKCKKV